MNNSEQFGSDFVDGRAKSAINYLRVVATRNPIWCDAEWPRCLFSAFRLHSSRLREHFGTCIVPMNSNGGLLESVAVAESQVFGGSERGALVNGYLPVTVPSGGATFVAVMKAADRRERHDAPRSDVCDLTRNWRVLV